MKGMLLLKMLAVLHFMNLQGMNTLASSQYHFININKTWIQAQNYCRLNYDDLATIETAQNMTKLTAIAKPGLTGKAWIGLYHNLTVWTWSLEDSSFYGPGQTTFRNWDSTEPNNLVGDEYCVVMNSGTHQWADWRCLVNRSSVCYDGRQTASQQYVYVSTLMTWFDARIYCRQHYTDLVSIRNQTENKALNIKADSWIGLHRTKLWSDGSNSTFTNWSPGEPNKNRASCVTVWMGDSGRWTDEDCTTTRPFFCYSGRTVLPTTILPVSPPKHVVRVKVKFSSATPLTDANITNEVLQQLREELIRRGLPRDIKLHLKPITVNSTQP